MERVEFGAKMAAATGTWKLGCAKLKDEVQRLRDAEPDLKRRAYDEELPTSAL